MMEKDYDKGFICDCCGSYVKRYSRHFNSNMAIALILLYRFNVNGFIKVEDFLIKNGQKRCGDFSYLVHYRFLEKQVGKRYDGSKKNGYYRLTSLGILFVEGKIKAHKRFIMLNGKFMGFEGEEITIQEALGKKFSFNELMGKFQPKTDKQAESLKQLNLYA